MKWPCHYNSAVSRVLLKAILKREIWSKNFGRDPDFDSDYCSLARCKMTKKLEVT
jgi:hypothetical protein